MRLPRKFIIAFFTVGMVMMLALMSTQTSAAVQSGTTLTATKSAAGHMERTYHWTIDKSVEPATFDMFTGNSGDATYTVQVTKDAGTDVIYVSGEICVTNGGSFNTENLAISDEVQTKVGSGQFQTLTTVSVDLGGAATLAAGESHCYPYSIELAPVAGASYRNVAHVTITNHAGWIPGGNNCPGPAVCPFGPDPKADFALPGSPDILINDSINVDDTNGGSWPFGASGSTSYGATFTCDADNGGHNNTATIRETGQSDDASVQVNCYALDVSKDAHTSLTRTYHWTIDKEAQAELNLFRGDTGSVPYAVTVGSTSADSDWAVEGTIWVHNPAPMDASLASVTDSIDGAVVDCPSLTVPAGGTLECSYSASLLNADSFTNTATATLNNTPSGTTDFTGSAGVDFSSATVTEVDETVSVGDSVEGYLGDVTYGPQTFNYDRSFTCDGDKGAHNNVADFETNDTGATGNDNATVTVNCYALGVSKDANTSLTRTWDWTIRKTGSQSNLTLAVGQSFAVNYTVTASATAPVDSGWAVSGTITVHNPAPMAATINSVTDILDDTVDCGVSFPYALAAGGDLACSYGSALPNANTITNTATATLQNAPDGTTDFSGSASVSFSGATVNKVDDCVAVSDDKYGALGSLCAGESPKTYSYSLSVGPYAVCGPYVYNNTASLVTNTTGSTHSSSWTVNVNVPCATGCTLTIGYWKTHAGFGPQRDMVTSLLPRWLGTAGGAKSQNVTTAGLAVQFLSFFGSNNVFDGSNGINKLYAQLLGAKLNMASGASSTSIASVLSAADAFLANNNSLNWAGLSKPNKNTVLSWMASLDNYNNGLNGPSHCSQ